MARLTPYFSASRAVREYTEEHYLPAAGAYRERAANKGARGRELVEWQHEVDQKWGAVRFGDVRVETTADHHVFEVEIFLNDLGKNAVQVELYANGINGGNPVRQEMQWDKLLSGASYGSVYRVTVPAGRPARDYTPRVMPHCDGVAVPLEDARILWQR